MAFFEKASPIVIARSDGQPGGRSDVAISDAWAQHQLPNMMACPMRLPRLAFRAMPSQKPRKDIICKDSEIEHPNSEIQMTFPPSKLSTFAPCYCIYHG
ncbi:hypothetical protein BC343_23330 [Mucilaginibacter pedocola]|uniref:Uncharacterized protein n=1 Tax=Mucilaginibacter pedocola TaxID=1792845 RepID=A0A1S9PJY3_9SPHI|nr:hypothetical protein BC343_23330 [Mucilaginibacter pedocola]